MHRAGADPLDMQPQDFLCDFCSRPWDGQGPMVEGHQGSLICGACLSVAYRLLVMDEGKEASRGGRCTLCLEEHDHALWRSPINEPAAACTRCVKQAAAALMKDKSTGWAKPA